MGLHVRTGKHGVAQTAAVAVCGLCFGLGNDEKAGGFQLRQGQKTLAQDVSPEIRARHQSLITYHCFANDERVQEIRRQVRRPSRPWNQSSLSSHPADDITAAQFAEVSRRGPSRPAARDRRESHRLARPTMDAPTASDAFGVQSKKLDLS